MSDEYVKVLKTDLLEVEKVRQQLLEHYGGDSEWEREEVLSYTAPLWMIVNRIIPGGLYEPE